MIQLASLMWAFAIFFAVMGFLRGWTKELIGTAGTVLGLFAIFQFDSLFRGTIFVALTPDQVFLVQSGIFLAIVFVAYQTQTLVGDGRRGSDRFQNGILGGIVGFFNGYLVAGTLWYFLDINEYPLEQFVTAPAADAQNLAALNTMPIVILSGGVNGTGDFLAVAVIILLFVVLLVL